MDFGSHANIQSKQPLIDILPLVTEAHMVSLCRDQRSRLKSSFFFKICHDLPPPPKNSRAIRGYPRSHQTPRDLEMTALLCSTSLWQLTTPLNQMPWYLNHSYDPMAVLGWEKVTWTHRNSPLPSAPCLKQNDNAFGEIQSWEKWEVKSSLMGMRYNKWLVLPWSQMLLSCPHFHSASIALLFQ